MKFGFLAVSLVVVGGVVAVGAVSARASSDNAAAVIHDNGLCGMPGADAEGNFTFGGIGSVTTQVQNNNKVTIKCKGTGITNDSGHGQSFNGFLCGIGGGDDGFFLTEDSHATVSASGVGTLTCTFTF